MPKIGQIARPDAARRLTGLADLVADYPISAMQVSYANAMLDGSRSLARFWLMGERQGNRRLAKSWVIFDLI